MKKAYIDICRGFGIVLVVLAHTFTPEVRGINQLISNAHHFIYTFHMPLFFVISGYVYQNSYGNCTISAKEYLKKKSNRLLKPYVLYSIFIMMLINVMLSIPACRDFLQSTGLKHITLLQALIQIVTGYVQWDIHIWFLYVLFVIVVVYYIIRPLMHNDKWILLLILFFMYLAVILVIYPFETACGSICKYMPYFLLGVLYRNKEQEMEEANIFVYMIIYVIFFAVTWKISNSALLGKEIIVFALNYGCGICGSMTVIAIAKKYFENKDIKLLKYLSDHSMSIYLYHQPFIVSGSVGIMRKITSFPTVIVCTIGFLLGIILPIFIERTIKWFCLKINLID